MRLQLSQAMIDVIRDHFDIPVTNMIELYGLDNKNYLVEAGSIKYIFKTYPQKPETQRLVEAENEALLHLNSKKQTKTPLPIAFEDGTYVKCISMGGATYICRMLSFIEGDFMGDIEHKREMMHSLGKALALIDLQLQEFRHTTFEARSYHWDIQQFPHFRSRLIDIDDAKSRSIVFHFLKKYESEVIPHIPQLRRSIVHNDANEWNILYQGSKVCGIIDFGDTCYTFLINELAIACAYAAYDKDDPLKWAVWVVEAYHEVIPLEETELKLLYYLIAARLCISVCISAGARKTESENDYAYVSEKNAWEMLHKWVAISPLAAENAFRKSAGFKQLETASIERLIAHRNKFLSSSLSVSYDRPIQMAGAAFQYMYDGEGNTFLDAYNNIPHVGHNHPKVVEAGQRQMGHLNTNTRYLYPQLAAYAERLLTHFPEELNKVFLVNSGSAATDLALRMASAHTGNDRVMVMEQGYHGNTLAGIEVSHYKFSHSQGQGQKNNIIVAPLTISGAAIKQNAPDHDIQLAMELLSNSPSVGAVISETILGCAGQVPLPPGYLQKLYAAIRVQGGVCIADEVQTGFGRTGDHFWAFEAQDVVPDIVILGKPMANGHPMGAVVCTEEIARSFDNGVEFFSSFGGNPVSCAIAIAVLEVIEEEAMQENAKRVGEHFQNLLIEAKSVHNCMSDIRGSGLFLGVEFSKKDGSPDTDLARFIKNELRNHFILVSTDGPFDNVLKSKPPLRFTQEDADRTVEEITNAIDRFPDR